ncbi:MAG: hypothetical protein JNK82_28495, partial [Myxococcaceae bacterium]|nr:hypothetical protein [Myxococcaceae bacterium]
PELIDPCQYPNEGIIGIDFTHTTDNRFNGGAYVRCTGASTTHPFTFSTERYPGTYKVTVRAPDSYDQASNLPRWSTVVNPAFVVSGPLANVTLDVPVPALHAVSGRVTRNGATPELIDPCQYPNEGIIGIDFTHTTDTRLNGGAYVRCTGASTTHPFTFSTELYPGTYKVTVRAPDGYDQASNLPRWSTVVNPAFVVSGPLSNVTLEVPVPMLHAVSGRITRNGATPLLSDPCQYPNEGIIGIEFDHLTDTRFNGGADVRCTGASTTHPFTFSTELYPGVYEVTVRAPDSYDQASNLPRWSTKVVERLRVP